MDRIRRFAPFGIPFLFVATWLVILAAWPIPATIDWTIVLFVVVLAAGVMGLQAAALVSNAWREWGIGAGILAALLAPFGASITMLALFSYQAGDLGPGWAESWSVIPALAIQVAAAAVVIAGLVLQRKGRKPASHRLGTWLTILGTLAGSAAVAAHLYAVAFDAV